MLNSLNCDIVICFTVIDDDVLYNNINTSGFLFCEIYTDLYKRAAGMLL